MQALSRWLIKRPVAWAIVVLVILLASASVFYARQVEQDDDVLAFLPAGNADVKVFYDVNRRFGGLDVAIAGVETKNVFSKDFLARLRTVTQRLNATEGVGYALTLTNVEDFAPDPEKGGIRADYLVRALPENEAEEQALRERVLSRDEVVGNLVDEGGTSALIYCFGVPGTNIRAMAANVRGVVDEAFPTETKYWGGAPFISTYIYNVTQEDLRRLAPWAVLVLVLITVASFRDFIGTGLALLSTALGILMALGLMGALGVHSNIVLGSMPLILLSLGSAYAVHFLSRYYSLVGKYGVEGAVQRTLTGLGPTIAASGLIAAVALMSFAVMDIKPMRTFGLFTALGLLAKLTLALTFVPAVLVLARLQGKKKAATHSPNRLAVGLMQIAQKNRGVFRVALVALFIAAVPFALRIDTRTDNSAFFSQDSPPDRAEKFLQARFGGAMFLQVEMAGDMTDPAVLRELALVADRIAAMPEVASVSHLGDILALTNDAMSGDRIIPDTQAKAKVLYAFLEGKRAVRQFVTDDRDRSLMQVKLRSSKPDDVERVLATVRALAKEHEGARIVARLADPSVKAQAEARAREATVARMAALAAKLGATMPQGGTAPLDRALTEKKLPVPTEAVEKALSAFLGSDEFIGDMPSEPADAKARVAAAAAKLGPSPSMDALTSAITAIFTPPPPPPDASTDAKTDAKADAPADAAPAAPSAEAMRDLASSIARPLAEIWRREQARAWATALVKDLGFGLPKGPKADRFTTAVASALLDLDRPAVLLPAGAGTDPMHIEVHVTGQPIINEGLSQSVTKNQVRSLGFALILVLIITSFVFRSLRTGLLATGPALLTVAILYAAMMFVGIRLDIGTSLLASLIVGAGTDYAIHALSGWEAPDDRPLAEAATRSAQVAGQGIWTNALMVACGFVVLTLGEAKPLKNVGGLTAAAMVLSAFATFFIIPAFAQKHRYTRGTRMPDAPDPSDAPEAASAEGTPAVESTSGGAPPNSPRSR